MAASSTDAYANNDGNASLNNNIPLFTNYPVVSVTTGPNHFWPGDVTSNSSTSPSSEQNWEIDEEETIKRRIYELKRQFHNGRFLIFRHLPRDTTEEDIRSLLHGTLVHSVQISPVNGSARVLLAEPEVLETWAKSSQRLLNGHKVTISPSNTDGLLCVARLPQDYTEEEFSTLVASLGEINYSFLMRSEKTGESKGYGFVEYVNKETAMQAKTSLDGRELLDCILVCEWLDPSRVTFASLHSTTLYVDHLPKEYRNMGEFRKIFSRVANPPYCQIAMMQGAIQNWGLVEFTSAEEAEETRTLLNGFVIQGHPLRVSYYVPGVRAINIYMKLLNDPKLKNRGALLPEPPTNKVFTQLKNLTKHNPAFAKSLQNIILTQIQALQQNSHPSQSLEPNSNGSASRTGRINGPSPNMVVPVHVQQTFFPHLQHPPPMQQSVIISPEADESQTSLNSNAQAALVILLAAQLQQQQEQKHPNGMNGISHNPCNENNEGCSILSNPQVLNLLQKLVSQGDPQQQSQEAPHLQPPAIPSPQVYSSQASLSSGHGNNAPTHNLSANLKNSFRNGYFKNGASKLQKGPLLPTPSSTSSSYPTSEEHAPVDLGGVAPVLTDLLNGVKESSKEELTSSIAVLLSNAQNLQHLLGSLCNENPQVPLLSKAPPPLPPPPPTILPHPPIYQAPAPAGDPVMSMLLRAADTGRPDPFIPHMEVPSHFLLAAPRIPPPPTPWQDPSATPPQTLFHPPAILPHHTTALHPRLYSPTVYLTPNRGLNGPPHPHPFSQIIGSPFSMPTGFSTPVGQKRKSNHFLPSPEPSPENGYIGQHSQGIGGHYQDSYALKKQKRH